MSCGLSGSLAAEKKCLELGLELRWMSINLQSLSNMDTSGNLITVLRFYNSMVNLRCTWTLFPFENAVWVPLVPGSISKTRSSLWYFFSAFCHCLRQNSWCFHKEWGPYQIWCGSTWNCTSRRRTGCLEMGGRGRGYASLGMLMPNSEAISSTRTNNHGLCCVCIVPRIPVFLPYSAVFWSVAFLLLSSSRIFPDFL